MLHNIRPRGTISAFIIIAVCFLFTMAAAQARAINGNDIPDRADVQDQLTALNNKKDLTPQDKLVQQDLTETLQLLDKIDAVKAESTALQKQIDQAPMKLRQATDNLNALSDVDNDDETRKTLSTLSKPASRRRLTICKMRKTISRLTTANWSHYKPSPSASRTR